MDTVKIRGVSLTRLAAETLEAVAGETAGDMLAFDQNQLATVGSASGLLALCLDGAEGSAVQGWREYVAALVAVTPGACE